MIGMTETVLAGNAGFKPLDHLRDFRFTFVSMSHLRALSLIGPNVGVITPNKKRGEPTRGPPRVMQCCKTCTTYLLSGLRWSSILICTGPPYSCAAHPSALLYQSWKPSAATRWLRLHRLRQGPRAV